MQFSAAQIAGLLHGSVEGDPNVVVSDMSKIEEGRPGTITFFSNPKYEHFVYSTQASIILVDKTFVPTEHVSATLVRVENSYEALSELLKVYVSMQPRKTGVEQPSYVAESATIGAEPYIGAFAYIGAKAKIGDRVSIYPQAYVGDGAVVGNDSILYPGAKVMAGCEVGARCVLHGGAVIGADGFGFAPDEKGVFQKIPQIGKVVLEDDVEIGANTCVDRSTMGATRVEHGVKLDNLIQIAHNVVVGHDTVMAAQVGIAGSTKIGPHCMFGGNVGVAGHIEVAERTNAGAMCGIHSTIHKSGQTLLGAPAIDARQFMKSSAVFKNLDKLQQRVDTLEKGQRD